MKYLYICYLLSFLAFVKSSRGEIAADVAKTFKTFDTSLTTTKCQYIKSLAKSVDKAKSICVKKLAKTNETRSDVYLPFARKWVEATQKYETEPNDKITINITKLLLVMPEQIGEVDLNDEMNPDYLVEIVWGDGVITPIFLDSGTKNAILCYGYTHFDNFHFGRKDTWKLVQDIIDAK
jgi:hypothetical protein